VLETLLDFDVTRCATLEHEPDLDRAELVRRARQYLAALAVHTVLGLVSGVGKQRRSKVVRIDHRCYDSQVAPGFGGCPCTLWDWRSVVTIALTVVDLNDLVFGLLAHGR